MTDRQNMCRVCYKLGHNRRTCPTLREKAAASPGGYHDRLLQNVEDKNKRERRCKYCNQSGHNRQTCQSLKDERLKALFANIKFRKDTLGIFQKHGIGLGTLLSFRYYDYSLREEQEVLLMIDEILWDEIIYQGAWASIKVNRTGEIDPRFHLTVNEDFFKQLTGGRIKVEVPADKENIGVGIPVDWLNGTSNMARAFSDWE